MFLPTWAYIVIGIAVPRCHNVKSYISKDSWFKGCLFDIRWRREKKKKWESFGQFSVLPIIKPVYLSLMKPVWKHLECQTFLFSFSFSFGFGLFIPLFNF